MTTLGKIFTDDAASHVAHHFIYNGDRCIIRGVFDLSLACQGACAAVTSVMEASPVIGFVQEHSTGMCLFDVETACSVAKDASSEGNLDVLKFLHANGYLWNQENGYKANGYLCFAAAKGGHLEVLKWLRENGYPWDNFTCKAAAQQGHLEVLKYLHEKGCPWDKRTCMFAAKAGHLDVLKYLHENGCPWNEYTCMFAADAGHLDMLKYLHENGCPWDNFTCKAAAQQGHLDVLKYLHENGCPWHPSVARPQL